MKYYINNVLNWVSNGIFIFPVTVSILIRKLMLYGHILCNFGDVLRNVFIFVKDKQIINNNREWNKWIKHKTNIIKAKVTNIFYVSTKHFCSILVNNLSSFVWLGKPFFSHEECMHLCIPSRPGGRSIYSWAT